VGEQLGTVVEGFARRHSDAGKPLRSSVMEAVTLTWLCEEWAPKEIHFPKFGVEGHEAEVLDGMDFAGFRACILFIETVEPYTFTATQPSWDQRVRNARCRSSSRTC
jgi:hypothetical protein